MKNNFLNDPLTRNIWYLSLTVFVLALQVLIVVVFIYQFIPLKMDAITQGVPASLLQFFKPNRNHFFYHVFIASALIGQAVILYLFRKRLKEDDLSKEVGHFLICESFLVSWQLFAVFKILQYDNPSWARYLLYTGMAAALLAKIFWPELKQGLLQFQGNLGKDLSANWRELIDAGVVLLLVLILAVPDVEKALVRMALVDSNNHFDQWLMTPLWAYHKGLVPALQSFSPLNWGAVALMHQLVDWMGGLSYIHVIKVLCFLSIIYYAAFYFLLRYWLGIFSAVFGVLLAVKLQMFNIGVNPLIWIFPGQSILRHLLDVAVFFFLLAYAKGQGEIFIWMASAAVGLSLGLVFDTGFYMLVAFYVYLIILLLVKETRRLLCPDPGQWRKVLGLVLLPLGTMFAVLVLCFGPAVCHGEFWRQSFKDVPQWLQGVGAISTLSCLRDRNFFAFFASFFPPLIYAAGSSAAIGMVYLRLGKSEKLFIVPLSVYGLGVYAHFLWHGTINYYYMVPLPLVGCVCFWGMQAIGRFNQSRQQLIQLILAAGAGIALFTNFFFTYYPNIFNISGQNWTQQESVYRSFYNFDHDADLVRGNTLPYQRVALIANFATKILLQADRASFFNAGLPLMSTADIELILDQLTKDKPRLVFVDRRIFISGHGALDPLVNFLKTHYQYNGQQSDDLVLLKTHE